MKTKLTEALRWIDGMTADINGDFPIGLYRVRRLLQEAIAEYDAMVGEWDEDDRIELTGEQPRPAA